MKFYHRERKVHPMPVAFMEGHRLGKVEYKSGKSCCNEGFRDREEFRREEVVVGVRVQPLFRELFMGE